VVSELSDTLIKGVAEIIAIVLSVLVTVIIPYAVLLFRAWAKAKIAEAKAKVESIENTELREEFESALARLDATADTVVADIESTIKKYTAEGKVLNPEKIKEQAEVRIRNRLDPASKQLLLKRFGDERFGKLVSSKVEQKALRLNLHKKAIC